MDTWVVVVGRDEYAPEAIEEIRDAVASRVHVVTFARATDVASWRAPDGATAALVVLMPDLSGNTDDQVEAVLAHPACRDPHVLLLTAKLHLDDVSRALDHRAVQGVVAAPWTKGSIGRYARAEVARWQRRHEGVGEEAVEAPSMGSELLRHLGLALDDATGELIEAIEETLGKRPRIHLPAGVRIAHERSAIDHIYVVLSGRVRLTMQSTSVGSVSLNHDSTGPVVGLMALADRHRSLVTAVTTTPVEVVQLTLEQLDMAIAQNGRVGALLTALTIRALSNRLRHAQRDRVEKIELTQQLRTALAELEQARADLVAQARMATIGELAAGIAHELNNPVAAMGRSVTHLSDDLPALLADDELASQVLAHSRERTTTDAAEDRAVRKKIARVTKDPVLARRLVDAGIRDPRQAKQLLKCRGAKSLAKVELAAGVGSALRALDLATAHITALVGGLRQHARPDQPADVPREPVQVEDTVDAALQLLGHRLRGIAVLVEAGDDLPPVTANPTELTQIWMNLITNAAEAMEGHGSLDVTLDAAEDRGERWVRVRIHDDGPGVPEELQSQIFEPRFTTKHGVVRFGLGLGLNIARSIVEAHEGSISLTSQPGNTCFEVRLPAEEES